MHACVLAKQYQVAVHGLADENEEFFPGLPVDAAAKIVLAPSVGVTQAAVLAHFPTPEDVQISARSVLVVEGAGVTIKKLDLDGTLVVRAAGGAQARTSKRPNNYQGLGLAGARSFQYHCDARACNVRGVRLVFWSFCQVCIDGLTVRNDGWVPTKLTEAELADPAVDDRIKIRNYRLNKVDQRVIEVTDAAAELVVTE